MALYKDGNPVSGINSIPRLTLAQYNALTVKPEVWIRTDAPESYKRLSADEVSYDSNNTVEDAIDSINDAIYEHGTAVTPSSSGKSTLLAYIADVIVPKAVSVYSFHASGFSDLPSSDWGFDVTVYNSGGLYVTAFRQLSNEKLYIRCVNYDDTWAGSWKLLNTMDFTPTSMTITPDSTYTNNFNFNVYSVGNLFFLTGFFYVTTEIPNYAIFATITMGGKALKHELFTTSRASNTTDVVRAKITTDGALVSETVIPNNNYYSFSLFGILA